MKGNYRLQVRSNLPLFSSFPLPLSFPPPSKFVILPLGHSFFLPSCSFRSIFPCLKKEEEEIFFVAIINMLKYENVVLVRNPKRFISMLIRCHPLDQRLASCESFRTFFPPNA